jgi:hypothetical protein
VKGRWLWIVICADLVVLVALAFVYPQLMLAPGALDKEHAGLSGNCFACHTPLRGATADRCIACHKLPDIGLRTTKGATIVNARPVKVSFHQELNDPNCMACHSDHAGPKLTQRSRKPFSHAMLREVARDRCETCHNAPADTLHKQMSGNCAQCHQPQAWKPASFDHDKFFPLDKDHNATCVTCHAGNNYNQYTCYGCHEHTPANMQAKHREEVGTENLDNCVRCHRSASGEGEGGGDGERGKDERERD